MSIDNQLNFTTAKVVCITVMISHVFILGFCFALNWVINFCLLHP